MEYVDLIKKVNRGVSFSINFKKRELRINKKLIDLKSIEWKAESELNFNGGLNSLYPFYYAYKHSVPSEKSERVSKHYFKALSVKELSDNDFMYGMPRELARFNLEMALLHEIVFGNLKWDNETMGTWFWQSPDDKDFIILKEWVSE